MPVGDALLAEFDKEVTTTRRVLERVPEDRFDWKPHAKSFSIGALAAHGAGLPTGAVETLTKSEIDLSPDQPPPAALPSREALLAAFDANAAAARAALAGRSDAELAGTWSLKRGGRTLFSMPKAAVLRSFVFNHLIHHRGQLTVYLRLLDVPVPAVYGPSADEPAL